MILTSLCGKVVAKWLWRCWLRWKILFKWHTFSRRLIITVMSHGIWDHGHIVCLFHPLFGLQEISKVHITDHLWRKSIGDLILQLHMKPISCKSKVSFACSVTIHVLILTDEIVLSSTIYSKINIYLHSAEKKTKNWHVNQVFVLITSWDTT